MEKALDLILNQGLLGALAVLAGWGYHRSRDKIEKLYEKHGEEMRLMQAAHKQELADLAETYAVKAQTAIEKGTELGVRVTTVLEAISRQQERQRRP